MKSRFSPLVKLKHSQLQEAEANLQKAHARVAKAKEELQASKEELAKLQTSKQGSMQEFLANRALFDAQIRLIEKNESWVEFEQNQLQAVKEELQKALLEYEKFAYLEAEELKAYQEKLKKAEAKQLDEIAVLRYAHKKEAV